MYVLPIDPLERVTGSCYLVDARDQRFRCLVDCGAYQDGADPELENSRPFPFDPRSIQAVLLTHAHYDHCGRIPRLVDQGFTGQLIGTKETLEIAKIVLRDSLRIQKRDSSLVDRIRWKPIGDDVLFSRPLPLATDVFLMAYRSAHIVGAVSLELIVGPKADRAGQTRVLFSGDVGNNREDAEVQPFLRHIMHPSTPVHMAVLESTYGDRARTAEELDPRARRARLSQLLGEALADRGAVVIPAFAVQRAQDVLWDLHLIAAESPSALRDARVYYDAPMALQMHPVLLRAMQTDMVSPNGKVRPAWLGAHVFRDLSLDERDPEHIQRARQALARVFGPETPDSHMGESEAGAALDERVLRRWFSVSDASRPAVICDPAPKIVIATGGMAEFGPVQAWLAEVLSGGSNAVLMSGYCASGTLGHRLIGISRLSPEERRRLDEPLEVGDRVIPPKDVRARLAVIGGYSAHADQAGLAEWVFPRLGNGERDAVTARLLLTHGTEDARRSLQDRIVQHGEALGLRAPEVLRPRPGGPGFEVRTGREISRESILNPERSISLQLSSEEAAREIEALRREVVSLRERNARILADRASCPACSGGKPQT